MIELPGEESLQVRGLFHGHRKETNKITEAGNLSKEDLHQEILK